MRLHFYKMNAKYYDDVLSGRKNFEVRKDDRKYSPDEGDAVIFGEWVPPHAEEGGDRFGNAPVVPGKFTGRRMLAGVGFVLRGIEARSFGIDYGYLVFGIRRATTEQLKYAIMNSSRVMPKGLSKKVKPMPKIEVPKL